MTVYCSYCSTGYLLPDHLLGPRGARVRCPKCGKTFVVLRDSAEIEVVAPGTTEIEPTTEIDPTTDFEDPIATVTRATDHATESGPATSARPAALVPADEALARVLLDALASNLGQRLVDVRGRGRVLSEFGPDLMRVVDDYRRRTSSPTALLAFKHVLRERWGVDLITGVEP